MFFSQRSAFVNRYILIIYPYENLKSKPDFIPNQLQIYNKLNTHHNRRQGILSFSIKAMGFLQSLRDGSCVLLCVLRIGIVLLQALFLVHSVNYVPGFQSLIVDTSQRVKMEFNPPADLDKVSDHVPDKSGLSLKIDRALAPINLLCCLVHFVVV